ncbi:MAG: cation:proton antiporter regulatory subunit [Chloroflexi bacterium]|nr:cation:proton antiporter regulatory subunit [Chloroflexota bacterium]MCC6893091.1 cation:proton antiporter regulatory subunit [Anaerolineae bacterium]
MSSIREIALPGIGQKFEIITRSGDKLVVIVHDDGRRELYHFYHNDPTDSISMISLDDVESRQVSAIIGGAVYKPKALESIEVMLGDLVIEWYKLEPNSWGIGKTIGELEVRKKTSATIVALINADESKIVNPGPDQVLRTGMTVVAMGERQQIHTFKRLILNGGP